MEPKNISREIFKKFLNFHYAACLERRVLVSMRFTNKERTQEWATALLESTLTIPLKKRGRHLGSVATMWDQHLGSYLGKKALIVIDTFIISNA